MLAAERVAHSLSTSLPVVSEEACPLVPFAPMASDGFRGQGILRKPPGNRRCPAILWIHGDIVTFPIATLRGIALAPTPSRFLAGGYVVLVPTYRSRDHDPQSGLSLADCLAVVNYARTLPYVDPESIVVYGCSGGGDLALEVASATAVCAVVPEEPATFIMAGIFNTSVPKRGERYAPGDGAFIALEPQRYYSAEYQRVLRGKLARINCPILLVQGDLTPGNRFNAEVLVPELRALDKNVDVLTYPGQPHCFCFLGTPDTVSTGLLKLGAPTSPSPPAARPPSPDAQAKAAADIATFCARHVRTKPQPIRSSLVRWVTI